MGDSMDIDIDLGDDIDYGQEQTDGMTADDSGTNGGPPQPAVDVIPEAYKDEFDADFPVREKVHIQGLDHVAQPLVYQYIEEHVPDSKLRRLEWIDDNSANLVYYKAEDAAEALKRLSVEQDAALSTVQLRPGKPFSARPDLQFSIRQALVSDRKKPGAKDRSAFYLFNPEWEPENRRGERRNDRRSNGDRHGGDRYGRDGSRRLAPRRSSQTKAEKPFTEDMYDDAPSKPGAEEGELIRRLSSASVSSLEDGRRKRKYEEADLFEHKRDAIRRHVGRLRDRSRSPARDGDGRYGFDEDQPRRKTARRRSFTPPGIRERQSLGRNDGRELFPGRHGAGASTPLSDGNKGIELFPNHSAKRSRELFPHKTALSNHRRTDALDKDETQEILTPSNARSLADRISGAPAAPAVRGRGTATEGDPGFSFKGQGNGAPGFSIRGASDAQSGFSIRGAAGELNPKVKELFPNKAGGAHNAGKELFPSIRGRGVQRSRAEDLFD